MKKIVYFFVALSTMIGGANVVSADQVTVPILYHRGATDYSMLMVRNNAGQIMNVTVTFNANILRSASQKTNTFTGSTSRNTNIAIGGTWALLTTDAELFSSTTSRKRAQVVIQSSGTPHPYSGGTSLRGASAKGGATDSADNGPMTVTALFVHLEGSTPTGFAFPTLYRTRTWSSGTAGQTATDSNASAGIVGSVTVDNWHQ